MNLRSPRYALALAIIACLAVYLLVACAPVRSRPILLVYEGCAGRTEYVSVEIMASPAPAVDCVRHAPEYRVSPAWLAIQMPIACALRLAEKALVVMPIGAPRWMVEHELMHVMDLTHAPFTWGPMECPPIMRADRTEGKGPSAVGTSATDTATGVRLGRFTGE